MTFKRFIVRHPKRALYDIRLDFLQEPPHVDAEELLVLSQAVVVRKGPSILIPES